MVMVSKFSNLPDELSENDEIREYELSESDCMGSIDREIAGMGSVPIFSTADKLCYYQSLLTV